jgi:hypothetical protein
LKITDLFRKLNRGELSSDQVMTFLRGLQGGNAFVDSDIGMALEAHLIWSDVDTEGQRLKLDELRTLTPDLNSAIPSSPRAGFILRYLGSLDTERMGRIDVIYFAKKIDLAASIRV